MRKENSSFKLNFLSQPGVRLLHNNDYFGCSELEGFACYVVADGLTSGNDKREDSSARLAVEAVISAFNVNPSIGRGAIARYLKAAHKALLDNKDKARCRASVSVVVTDYSKLRYGYAGNCRFNLYRGGRLIEESSDNSLSWEMSEKGLIQKDKVAHHEERNNLTNYCGVMKSFRPSVSKKIKLRNADIFSLFTRGIWESARTDDILASIQSAENDPEEASRYLERLILDKTPPDGSVDNYTVCFVFVDKIYIDAERGKRRKKIIIISVIAVLLVAIIVVVIILYSNWRERMRDDMQLSYHNGIQYIQAGNFIRAKEELQTAYGLAERLSEKKHKNDINNYILFADAVVYADELFEGQSYDQAVDAYGAAANQSRYADNLSMEYITTQREKAANYLNVHEYIYLGDSLVGIRDWDNAEEKYLAARNLASRIYYSEGRRMANDSLDALYQLKQEDIDEQREAAGGAAQGEVAAAEFVIQGDNALRDGDFTAASLYYKLAVDRYTELGNKDVADSLRQRLALVQQRLAESESRLDSAIIYVKVGDELTDIGQYIDAKRVYLLARDIFASLGDEERLRDVQTKIELVDLYLASLPMQPDDETDSEEQNELDTDADSADSGIAPNVSDSPPQESDDTNKQASGLQSFTGIADMASGLNDDERNNSGSESSDAERPSED